MKSALGMFGTVVTVWTASASAMTINCVSLTGETGPGSALVLSGSVGSRQDTSVRAGTPVGGAVLSKIISTTVPASPNELPNAHLVGVYNQGSLVANIYDLNTRKLVAGLLIRGTLGIYKATSNPNGIKLSCNVTE